MNVRVGRFSAQAQYRLGVKCLVNPRETAPGTAAFGRIGPNGCSKFMNILDNFTFGQPSPGGMGGIGFMFAVELCLPSVCLGGKGRESSHPATSMIKCRW